ncbi:MAG TPA: SRPBCC family protein [Terracidiphilus sp.]|nr:SRPBCC family protein [Terracidiphilus sp.]
MQSISEYSSISYRSQGTADPAERVLNLTSGALLMLPVLGKRSPLRWTAAAAGGALIYCGLSGTRSASRLLAPGATANSKQRIRQSVTIGRSASELFTLWRNPGNLEKIRLPFEQLTVLGSDHVRWTMKLPAGSLEIEALLVEERPNELVHWRSTSAGPLQVDERMRFKPAPQDRGTEATLDYEVDFSRMPAGELLRPLSSFFHRAPQSAVKKVLENFKSLAETGEVPTLKRNPSARAINGNGKGDWI